MQFKDSVILKYKKKKKPQPKTVGRLDERALSNCTIFQTHTMGLESELGGGLIKKLDKPKYLKKKKRKKIFYNFSNRENSNPCVWVGVGGWGVVYFTVLHSVNHNIIFFFSRIHNLFTCSEKDGGGVLHV